MYAHLCKRLAEEAPNFEPPDKNSTFHKLLLSICHNKFYRSPITKTSASSSSSSSSSSINTSAANQQQQQDGGGGGNGPPAHFEDEEKQLVAKHRMLGNVKFIGELCKLDMLSNETLHRCIQELFENKSPQIQYRCEAMECLCQLIRTCGKNLDTDKGKLLMEQYFESMERKSHSMKYPPRIRFMLRDVIDLRYNNWKPRKVAMTEGPVPIQQLRVDEDIRPGYINNRNRDLRNNERDGDNWMNRLQGLNDIFSNFGVSSTSPIIQPYGIHNVMDMKNNRFSTSQSNSYGGGGGGGGGGGQRDHRDSGNNNNSGGNYRGHNTQRSVNQNHHSGGGGGGGGGGSGNMGVSRAGGSYGNHNNHNNRYGKNINNNGNISGSGGGGMMGMSMSGNGNQSGGGGGGGGGGGSGIGNNSGNDLAPRFKRNMIAPPQEFAENLQMRPAANSLLFKANININKTQLPLTQLRPNTSAFSHAEQYQQQHQAAVAPMFQQSSGTREQNMTGGGNNGGGAMGNNSGTIGLSFGMSSANQNSGANNSMQKRDNRTPNNDTNNGTAPKQLLQSLQSSSVAQIDKPQAVVKPMKKDRGPTKEECLKKVNAFIIEHLVPTPVDINDTSCMKIVPIFIDFKIPDKFMRDSLHTILGECLDKTDIVHQRTIEFLVLLRKEIKINNNTMLDSFKTLINGMHEREATVPKVTTLVGSLLARAVNAKLCQLSDLASYTEGGQHYPLFLLVLQHLYKTLGKQPLVELFAASKVQLMQTLPEADRSKDRMAEILEDRNLSFLYPLLKVQSELWKQIQADPNPQQFYKWIRENVEANCFTDPGFVTAVMTVLLKYVTQETTLSEGIDTTKNPDKILVEKEMELFERYCRVLNAFLNGNPDLQLIAIYALQVFCNSADFPKGMLLRWFTALYELNVIEEDTFLRWREDISDLYPGKCRALFQVNTWLTWLESAESEDEDYDE